MVEAERGLTPIGLAGVPYDDSYAAAVEPPRQAAQEDISDEAAQAQGANTPLQQDEDVNNVLNGMFDLFENSPPAAATAAATAAAATAAAARPRSAPSQQTLVLPKANVDQPETRRQKPRLLDQIFGVDEAAEQPREEKRKKKKKKKTLFERIF
jgi:hypothetical protein